MTQDNAAKAKELLAAEFPDVMTRDAIREGGTIRIPASLALRAITKALQPSSLSGDAVSHMASVLRNTLVGHPFPDGTRQTLADALCDGLNWTPNDDSAADVYEAVQSLARAALESKTHG